MSKALEQFLQLLVAWGSILYLAAPVYHLSWIFQQRKLGADTHAGIVCLLIWVVTSAACVGYAFTGAWYSEYSRKALSHEVADIIGVLALGGFFFLFPVGSMMYLRKRSPGQ